VQKCQCGRNIWKTQYQTVRKWLPCSAIEFSDTTGWGTPDGCGHIAGLETKKTVVAVRRVRLAGKAVVVKGIVEPIATSVTRKNPSDPVATVRCGCAAEHEKPCI